MQESIREASKDTMLGIIDRVGAASGFEKVLVKKYVNMNSCILRCSL